MLFFSIREKKIYLNSSHAHKRKIEVKNILCNSNPFQSFFLLNWTAFYLEWHLQFFIISFSVRKLASRYYLSTYFCSFPPYTTWCFTNLNNYNFIFKVRVVRDRYTPHAEKALRGKGVMLTLISESNLLGLRNTWVTVCPWNHCPSAHNAMVAPGKVHICPLTAGVNVKWWWLRSHFLHSGFDRHFSSVSILSTMCPN